MPVRVISCAHLPLDPRSVLEPVLGDVDYVAPVSGEFTRAELFEHLPGASALIALLGEAVNDELLDCAPLKVVANYAVGYDNVDLAAATRRGVLVTNTPDVLTDATADLAFALLIGVARRLGESERFLRAGKWKAWSPTLLLGLELRGKTLGVIGAGRIGRALLERARGFGMSLCYLAPRPSAEAEALGARRLSRQEFFSSCDFVSVHCPLNEETRHVVDADALAQMKPRSVLVNTARGGCVDNEALAAALQAGEIFGAGLDVFDHEPEVPAALLACERALLLPHIGSATLQARSRMAQICAEAIADVMQGRCPPTALNPEVLS